jgi:2,4-dienoyl-CoA reductase-like NADH-dependent reductase (Old Yellow Enzyme family)
VSVALYYQSALSAVAEFGLSPEVQFARHLKENVKNILVGTVGLITESKQANDLLEDGAADVVLMAREVLRDIDFPLRAARELGAAVYPLAQYEL